MCFQGNLVGQFRHLLLGIDRGYAFFNFVRWVGWQFHPQEDLVKLDYKLERQRTLEEEKKDSSYILATSLNLLSNTKKKKKGMSWNEHCYILEMFLKNSQSMNYDR
jgi:hypothetical protein